MAPSLRATEEVDGEGSGWIGLHLKSRPWISLNSGRWERRDPEAEARGPGPGKGLSRTRQARPVQVRRC